MYVEILPIVAYTNELCDEVCEYRFNVRSKRSAYGVVSIEVGINKRNDRKHGNINSESSFWNWNPAGIKGHICPVRTARDVWCLPALYGEGCLVLTATVNSL